MVVAVDARSMIVAFAAAFVAHIDTPFTIVWRACALARGGLFMRAVLGGLVSPLGAGGMLPLARRDARLRVGEKREEEKTRRREEREERSEPTCDRDTACFGRVGPYP